MSRTIFLAEADSCRRQAIQFQGRAEEAFLLRVAKAFDELAMTDVLFENYSQADSTLRQAAL